MPQEGWSKHLSASMGIDNKGRLSPLSTALHLPKLWTLTIQVLFLVVNFVPILIFFCLFLYLLSVLSFYLFCVYILLLLARVQGGQTSCTLWGHTIMRDPWTIPPCSWAIIFLSSKFSYFISFCRKFGYLLNFFPLRTAHKYNAYMV